DGSVDKTFGSGFSGANNTVTCVAVQSDGSVLMGGEFTVVNGQTRNYIARLNADGSLDTNFGNGLAGPNGPVDSMAIQSDGKLLIRSEEHTSELQSRSDLVCRLLLEKK